MEEEVLNPVDPRPFIQLDNGRVYKENYKPVDDSYADTFEEYAKQMNKKIEYDPLPADPKEIPAGAVDVGTTKATGATAKAIDLNRRAREASAQVTEQTEIDAIAEAFFNIEGAGPKYIYDKEAGVGKRVEPDLQEYLGDAYPLYAFYKKTGKLELSLVPQEIKDKVVNEAKESAREIVYREAGEGEVLNKARAMKIEGGAALLQQRKQDVIDYEKLTGMPLVREEKLNGRIFRPPYFNLAEDPQVAQIQKQRKAAVETRIELTNQAADDWVLQQEEYIKKVNEINQRIDQGKVVVPSEIYSLQVEAIDLNRAAADLNLDITKINEAVDELQLNNEELVSLAKNYSKMDNLAVILEDSFVASSAMVGSKLLEYGLAAMEGTADFFNLEGAQLQIQEAQAAAAKNTYVAINYNERLKDQLQYNFPKPLELSDDSSVGAYVADMLLNNGVSLITALGTTYGTGGAGALLSGTAFFVMEAGGKIADMEITQKNAPQQLAILNAKFDAATTNMEKAALKKQIDYYENALGFTEFQKGFAGLYYGGIAAYSETLGGAAIFKNFQRMSRGYGYYKYKKLVNNSTAEILSKTTGMIAGAGGGMIIEEIEETVTALGQNFGDIVVLGEDKSIIDGIDAEFFINVAVTSLAIQGGGIASNIQNQILSEISTNQERAEFNALRDKVISIQARLNEEGISVEEKEKLKEERRNIIREASAKVTVAYQKLSNMTSEEVELLFENNAELRKIRKQAQELAANREVGEYGNARLKELKARYDEAFAIRNSLLGKVQAKREADIKSILEEQSGVEGLIQLQGLKLNEVNFTPEVNFNIGLYNVSKNLARESGITLEIDNTADGNAAFDQKAKKIILNEALIYNTLLTSDRFNARIAAVSPLHEVGHARVAEKKIFKDKKIAQNSLRLIDDFKFYTAQQLDFGRINQKQHDQILNRLNDYLGKGFGAETNVDELFQLVNDLVNTGVFKNSSLGGLSSLKQNINGVLQNIFGDSYHLFTVDNIKEARAFVASYNNKFGKVQLPDAEDEETKFSLADEKIKSVRKDDILKGKTNAIYKENLEYWMSNNERRKGIAADKILGQGNAYMDLMEAYARRSGYTNIPGFEMDMFLILAKNRLIQHILNFNTKEGEFQAANDDLHAWINSQAANKAKQAVKDMNLDPDVAKSLSEEGVQKQVEREIAEQEPAQAVEEKKSALKKAAKVGSVTNFIRETNKAFAKPNTPDVITATVVNKIYESLGKYIDGLASSKKFKFEVLPGSNKITLTPEAKIEFEKDISEFLINELTAFIKKEVLNKDKKAYNAIVKGTFKLYKLLPQYFLNKRIPEWTEPVIDPRTGKQARMNTADGGLYGGAKGNPLFKRIDITEQQWVDYFTGVGDKPSTKSAKKTRFASMLANGLGSDFFLRYLNEENEQGELINLQQFVDATGIPAFDGANAYGLVLTDALNRDPDAFRLKYSLGMKLTADQAAVLAQIMPEIINKLKEQGLLQIGSFYVMDILDDLGANKFFNEEEINKLSEFIVKEFTKRLPSNKQLLGKLDIAADLTREQILFLLFKPNSLAAFGLSEPQTSRAFEDTKDLRHATLARVMMADEFTKEELFLYILGTATSGGASRLLNEMKDLVRFFPKTMDMLEIPIKNSDKTWRTPTKKDFGTTKSRQQLQGPNLYKALNSAKNLKERINDFNKKAEEAQNFIIKLAKFYKKEFDNAKTDVDKAQVSSEAFTLLDAMANHTQSTLRATAKLALIERGLLNNGNPRSGYFEHALPVNNTKNYIGLYITGRLNEKDLNDVVRGGKALLISRNTQEKLDSAFKTNTLSFWNIGDDQIIRINNSITAGALKDVVFENPLNTNDIIDFSNLPFANTAEQALKDNNSYYRNFDKSNYKPLLNRTPPQKTLKYSLNTSIDIQFHPIRSVFDTGSVQEYISDKITIGPLQDDQAYVIYLGVAKTSDDRKYLMFNFTLQDGEYQHSTKLEGNFAEKNINPFRLFGTIGNSLVNFLQNQDEFEGIEFSGSGESRIRLYDRLAAMLAKKLGWDLDTEDITIANEEYDGDVEYLAKDYYIFKPKPNLKYSLNDLSKDFNLIIEDKFGIEEFKRFSQVVGKRRGAKIDKWNFKNFFFPPSAEDFMGLMYSLLGKGKKGDAQKQWIMENIVVPYTVGIAQLDSARQSIKRTHRNLLAENYGVKKLLRQKIEDGDYTYDQALRVYLWNKKGVEIPGLSERDQKKLVAIVAGSDQLKDFANTLLGLSNMDKGWPDPSEYWDTETLLSDLNNLTQGANRKEYLKEFIDNVDAIFSEQNKNKLRAALGNNWVEAMEDVIYRMKNGINRPSGANKIVNAWNNWVNRSVGAIMFFNRRSALLQTLSTVNFINWSDNNPIKAAVAFANQKQYWKDFVYIFNSDKLKERRGGLKTDVSEAEIANAAGKSKNDPSAVLSYLLKIGFTLTQIADSFAISAGGATFYRNRVNTYLEQGLEKAEAEEKAWMDFSRISDELQQSSDPMLISQEQASILGRLVLAFQNTSAQYTRRGRKGISDLINGRGDFKTNLSVSLYYLAVQNIMFNALQNALFTFIPGFDDEPEDETLTEKELKRKQQKDANTINRALNGSLDTVLRGMGVRGAAVATLKNMILKFYEQEEKEAFFRDDFQIVLEGLNISPPIGSKARKFYNALRTRKFEKDVIDARGFDLFIDGRFKPSPMYSVIGNAAAALANIPLDRAYDETVSIAEAFDSRNSEWQRLALALGYKTWTVGAKFEEEDLIKQQAKALRKKLGIEKAKKTRAENRRKKDSIETAKIKAMSVDEYIKYLNDQKKKKNKK